MTHLRILLAAILLSIPFPAAADLSAGDLPGGTVWYLHADLEQIRSTESGRELYGWFQGEVVVELNDHLGFELDDEVDRVTAFSDTGEDAVIVLEGPLSGDTREKILEMARKEGDLERRQHEATTYYRFHEGKSSGEDEDIESLKDGGYFTLDVDGKLIVASDERKLTALIDSGGRITGAGSTQDALFVLTADKKFVQAGMRTGEFADDDDDWDSNILRNTEQAALLVSDLGGMLAVEAKLVSADAQMTESIGNIVSGLISLQAFNSEMDPAISGILRNTKVDVAEKVLSISTVLDPSVVVTILED